VKVLRKSINRFSEDKLLSRRAMNKSLDIICIKVATRRVFRKKGGEVCSEQNEQKWT
jgi:type IV secretory pathway ATPase VirB11/archaellum biosynthesis ATPase